MMKELSVTDVQAVSGAGKVQDALTAVWGHCFSHAAAHLNSLFDVGYDVDAALLAGEDFGSRLGKAIEDKFANLLERIQAKVIG